MLTKQEAYDKELETANWLLNRVKGEISAQLNQHPCRRTFNISLFDQTRLIPSAEQVIGARKFLEAWLSEHGWKLVEYNRPYSDIVQMVIE